MACTSSAVAGAPSELDELGAGTTNLGRYSSTLACTNALGGTLPIALNTPFTLAADDSVSCTLTNKAKPATLTLRQLVQNPVPINVAPPYTFSYTGNNGWTTQSVTNTSKGTFASSPTQTLSAVNTDTFLSTTMPDRWLVASLSCADTNAAVSGNPTGELVRVENANKITIPAAYVRSGASLRCTALLSRLTP